MKALSYFPENVAMTQFDIQYKDALLKILNTGYDEYDSRRGTGSTKALPGITFELDYGFPLLTLRKIPLKIFIAEQIWYIIGSQRPDEFVQKYTKVWDDFMEPDGTVMAAYGYRWRHHFGRDQLKDLLSLMTNSPGSRHGVVVTWDPADDGLGTGTKKMNVPCPYTFTVNVIGNKLHMHNVVRSNDMMLGVPHDVAGFALLMYILAAKLGLKPGKYTHTISNAHIYQSHLPQALELVDRTNNHGPVYFDAQEDYYDRAERGDHSLVDEIFKKLQSQYSPLPPLGAMKIVV